MAKEELRILASRAAARQMATALSRRRFLGLGAAAGAAAVLAACGSSKKASTSTTTGGTTTAPGGTTTAVTETIVPTGKGKKFNLYTWAAYDDPDVMGGYGAITIDIFNNMEEAIQKLATASGDSGYDVVVPTGIYIPQMVSKNLLEELDLSKIPNFKNLDTRFTNQAWDPNNKHSVCKDWGSLGWFYDKTAIKTPINTWSDFIKVAQTEASGQTTLLDSAQEMCGVYFFSHGIPWTTEKKADLDACETFLVNELAPHIKSFDSYPGIGLTQGNFALSQVWNGDARAGLLQAKKPEQFAWGLGAPDTQLWMDNWAIVKGAKNTDAAYAFMNYILDPPNSVKDLEFHGYNTGLANIQDLVPKDLKYPEIIFFDDAQVKQMHAGAVNTAEDRLVEIYNKVKAKAGA
jgi:spermidine/putrescine transport system substrate-binding protein